MEIEFKFKVDLDQVKKVFLEKYQKLNLKISFEDVTIKEDKYYFKEGSKDPSFRLRSVTWRKSTYTLEDTLESFKNGCFKPCEKLGNKTYLTHKIKRKQDGIEINKEFEFELNQQNLNEVKKLIDAYSLYNLFTKTKVCLGLHIKGCHLEFVNIKGNYFAEIEYTEDKLSVEKAIELMEDVCKLLDLDCSNKISDSWDKVIKSLDEKRGN